MLNKRATILFSQDQWRQLSIISESQDASVGELVREAVVKVYLTNTQLEQRQQAVSRILAYRQRHSGIDYKQLINEGRKY